MLRTTALALAVIALAAACGGASATPPASSGGPSTSAPSVVAGPSAGSTGAAPTGTMGQPVPSVDAAAIAAARQQIYAAKFSDPASLDAIDRQLRFTAKGEAAARALLDSAATLDGQTLWTALWIYASSGSDPAPLEPLVTHEDASIRAMAAATLVALGSSSGFAALKALLTEQGQLLGSSPPLSIGGYSVAALARYISAPGTPAEPAAEEDLTALPGAWSSWLEQNAASLTFDAQTGTWTTS